MRMMFKDKLKSIYWSAFIRYFWLAMDRDLWEMRMGYILWRKWLIIHLKQKETDQYICIKRTTINILTPKSD